MRRATRSDVDTLLQEARAIELLANEIDFPVEKMQAYWSLATDLITLVSDIEHFQFEHQDASYDDPAMFVLKHRLREIISRLTQLSTA